VTEIGSGLVGR